MLLFQVSINVKLYKSNSLLPPPPQVNISSFSRTTAAMSPKDVAQCLNQLTSLVLILASHVGLDIAEKAGRIEYWKSPHHALGDIFCLTNQGELDAFSLFLPCRQ